MKSQTERNFRGTADLQRQLVPSTLVTWVVAVQLDEFCILGRTPMFYITELLFWAITLTEVD